MKVFKKDNCFWMDDNGTVTQLTPDKWYYLTLPANSVNRKFVSCKKVDKAPNQTIDYGNIVKESRTLGPQNRKNIMDYMSDEDKATYLAILERAKKAKEAASKPMTELEKAQRAYEKALSKLEALKQ